MVKNAPYRIYLQVGEELDLGEYDFCDLSNIDITWCQDKVNSTDLCYVRSGIKEPQSTDKQQLKAKISTLISEIYGNQPADRVYSREEVISYLKRVETSAF